MLLIADAGSTKADWAWVAKDGESSYAHTRGFNPVVHPKSLLEDELKRLHDDLLPKLKPKEIHYYGAGCWDYTRKVPIREALAAYYPDAEITVMHDLLGAARASCGSEPGIACILGTGSNTCLYDGADVVDNVTNLGYMLGDEGSGSHIGKAFLRAYFYRELDNDIRDAFEEFSKVDKSDILDNIYGSDMPNTYMASFTRFMGDHLDNPLIQRIIFESFAEFLDRHVRKYKGHLDVPIHYIGSIAYHFKPILQAAMAERNLKMGNFVHKPIEALATFHRRRMK